MKREFTFAWVCWAAIVVFGEFLAVPEMRPTVNVVALVIFLAVEGIAIGRPRLGDTLSEHVWAFYGSKKGRIPLLVGASLFFAVRLYEIRTSPVVLGELDLGRAFLVAGLVGWLIPHFVTRGRTG